MVVGLGNPGADYADTRHNVGYLTVERLAVDLGASLHVRGAARTATATVEGKQIVLGIVDSFMNTCGPKIARLVKDRQVSPERLLVIHDDLDLDFAAVRLKKGGGAGGHKGLKSITGALKTDAFIRVRIGIGRPPGRMDPADFVLAPFKPKELPEIEVAITQASAAAAAVINQGLEAAMNIYNRR